jgi:hypothetical protein
MTRVAVARKRNLYGFAPDRLNVENEFRIMELRQALEKTYYTDAHLVTYIVEDIERQPRIRKAGLELYRKLNQKQLFVECFLCDVDTPEHRPWTEQQYAEARTQDATLPILSTAGVYYTKNGRRIVQPLATPLEVSEVEPNLLFWLIQLYDAGVPADFQCRDWTRHYRLPHVTRDKIRAPSRCLDLSRMRPVELPPLPDEPLEDLLPEHARTTKRRKASSPRRPKPTAVRPTESVLPEFWRPIVAPVAEAVSEIKTQWHTLFMALAGSMLTLRVPPENIEALCVAISLATHADDRPADRANCARSTIERYSQGEPFTALGALRAEWPTVASVLESAVQMVRLTPAAPAAPSTPVVTETRSLEQITAALEAAIENAPPGLTVIKAECGLGKTHAALRVAARRARTPYKTDQAEGLRAPANSKTGISVDKNNLAIQCARELAAMEQPSVRLFGPLSLRDSDGKTVCRLYETAEPLVAGGQRMQWELCQRRNGDSMCPHYDTCDARQGQQGDSQSRITISTHSLLGSLDDEAGATGLLVIDEVPDFLETSQLTSDEILETIQAASTTFDGLFAAAMLPVLWAWLEFITEGTEGEAVEACEAVRRFERNVPPEVLLRAQRAALVPSDGDAVECAIDAPFPEGHRGHAPPVMKFQIDAALSSVDWAHKVGRLSKVMKTAHHAMKGDYPVVIRVEERRGKRQLFVTAPREMLARALRRDGAVVVTDANADLHLPILTKVVSYEPPYHVFVAPDGAPIERTMIRTRHATRKAWLKNGKLDLNSSLVQLVRTAFEWVAEDPNTKLVGLITILVVECAIRHAAGIDVMGCRKDWKSMGQPSGLLDAFSEALAPILESWPGTLLTAHYGATRGLNDMAQADALLTLGDPWLNLGAARSDAAFLQLEAHWNDQYKARCRAELEQAHGRLRAVHRKRPGRALHVGAVMPGGSGWAIGKVEVRQHQARQVVMSAEEFARAIKTFGSGNAAAKVLGCSVGAIVNYRNGTRAVPSELAERLATEVARVQAE